MASDNKKSILSSLKWGRDIGISPDRLMAFTDGVFAIAITLLVLGLELPDTNFTSGYSLYAFMHSILPFISTINISFILLGGFWIYHHEFVRVKRVTVPFLWISIIYLLFVMYLPFTISVVGRYVEFAQANILFGVSLTLTALWLLFMFYFAEKTNILEEDLIFDKHYTYETITIIMLLVVVVSLLSYFVSDVFQGLYLLMPVYSSLRAVRHERVKINNQRTSIEDLLREPAQKDIINREDAELVQTLSQQFSAQNEESFKNEIEFLVKQEILIKIQELGDSFAHMGRDDKNREIADMRRNIMGMVDEAVSEELKKYE